MRLPFRKYEVTVDWMNDNTGEMHSCLSSINLSNVKEWSSVDNNEAGFPDKKDRTLVMMYEQCKSQYIRVPYKEFDLVMDNFLYESKLLDDGSLPDDKKKLERKSIKWTYNGPVAFVFGENEHIIACNVFPQGCPLSTPDDIIFNVLQSMITTKN